MICYNIKTYINKYKIRQKLMYIQKVKKKLRRFNTLRTNYSTYLNLVSVHNKN